MLRIRFLIMLGVCFLGVSAAWADDVGYVDCSKNADGTQIFAKPRKTPEVLATVPCGERFTILVYGFYFSRIQTKDGQVGFIYSSLIAVDRGVISLSPAAHKDSTHASGRREAHRLSACTASDRSGSTRASSGGFSPSNAGSSHRDASSQFGLTGGSTVRRSVASKHLERIRIECLRGSCCAVCTSGGRRAAQYACGSRFSARVSFVYAGTTVLDASDYGAPLHGAGDRSASTSASRQLESRGCFCERCGRHASSARTTAAHVGTALRRSSSASSSVASGYAGHTSCTGHSTRRCHHQLGEAPAEHSQSSLAGTLRRLRLYEICWDTRKQLKWSHGIVWLERKAVAAGYRRHHLQL
jgi:hypothetical protein